MTEILEKDSKKSLSFRKLVLQPRKDVGKLRYWLFDNGFSITNEALVREGKYICEIITAVPKEIAITRQMNGDDIEYEFPHSLIDYKDDLLEEYLSTKRNLEAEILSNMKKGKYTTPREIRHQTYRVEYIDYLLRRIDDEN